MKKIIFLSLVSLSRLFAQEKSLTPAYYFTFGKYSNDVKSYSNALYASFYLNAHDYIIGEFENLDIKNPYWTYAQKLFLIGGMKNLYPFYLKFNYAYVSGKFKLPGFNGIYNYEDKINIINPEIIWNYYLVFLGVSYVHLDFNGGVKSLSNNQYGLFFGSYVSDKFFLSLRPFYSALNDSRKLWSLRMKLTWFALSKLDISFAASIGHRAYFFDPEYLTIFNQDETQNAWYEARIKFKPSENFTLTAYYQYTDFTSYTINYLGAGVSYKFDF